MHLRGTSGAGGAHIEAIAAQLGHPTTTTTMQYVRYDRMTHVTEVRAALDAGAKLASVPWDQGPRLLADLPADERARFLGNQPGAARERQAAHHRHTFRRRFPQPA